MINSKRIVWIKGDPDFEILFRLMDGLHTDTVLRYWISEQSKEVDTCDMREDVGHTVKEVKIAFPISYSTLTSAEEDTQCCIDD